MLFALLAVFPVAANSSKDEAVAARDSLIKFFENKYSAESAAALPERLADSIGDGSAEWVYLSLVSGGEAGQSAAFAEAIKAYVPGNSPVERQRIAITMTACGIYDKPLDIADETVGKLGIMSNIFALPIYDAYGDGGYKKPVTDILSARLSGGGWALSGAKFDIDVTAMAVTMLSRHRDDPEVSAAVDEAIALLSEAQQDTGDYISWGVRNSESGCQVILALTACGIDIFTDERFIKNGNTLLDGLMLYRRGDGGFAHTPDGKSNANASYQALMALTAIKEGRSFYAFLKGTAPERGNDVSEDSGSTPDDVSQEVSGTVSGGESVTPGEETSPETSEETSVESSKESSEETSIELSEESSKEISEETSAAEEPPQAESAPEGGVSGGGTGRKFIVAGAILLLGAVCIAVLKLLKKLNTRRLLAIIAAAVILAGVSFAFNVRTPEEYAAVSSVSEEYDCTVTLTLDYGEAAGNHAGTYTVGAVKGDSVYDVLRRFASREDIRIDVRGSYVRGIDGVYEFDVSPSSGWMYSVNGEFPMVTATDFYVSDGDEIIWKYVS